MMIMEDFGNDGGSDEVDNGNVDDMSIYVDVVDVVDVYDDDCAGNTCEVDERGYGLMTRG